MGYIPILLTAPVTLGSTFTNISTTPLSFSILPGDLLAIVSGLTSQTFIATGSGIGSPNIGIEAEVASFTFPIGAIVVDQTNGPGPQFTPETCSTDTLTLWNFLPPFLQEIDQANSYTFLSWLEGIGSQQQIVDNLARDTPDNVGWSIVLDVTRCPTYALPWLAQFVGIRFNGSQLTNPTAMRSAISNPGNWTRGTLATIQNAAGAAVTIVERYPDPYSITILVDGTLSSLTYAQLDSTYATYNDVAAAFPLYNDFGVNSTIETVEAAVIPTIPAGLVPHFDLVL